MRGNIVQRVGYRAGGIQLTEEISQLPGEDIAAGMPVALGDLIAG